MPRTTRFFIVCAIAALVAVVVGGIARHALLDDRPPLVHVAQLHSAPPSSTTAPLRTTTSTRPPAPPDWRPGFVRYEEGLRELFRKLAPVQPAQQRTSSTRPYSAAPEHVTTSGPCAARVRPVVAAVWHYSVEWAVSVVCGRPGHPYGESNGQATANDGDGYGWFAIELWLHGNGKRDDWFTGAGCDSATQWSDPTCNTRAAWYGYVHEGARPWR